MLKIHFDEQYLADNGYRVFFNYPVIFDYQFNDKWMTPQLIKAAEGIDGARYVGNNTFISETLGAMPSEWMSGGFKMLSIIQNVDLHEWVDPAGRFHHADKPYCLSSMMGENVFEYLGPVIDSLPYDVDMLWSSFISTKIGTTKVNALMVADNVKINSWDEVYLFMSKHPEYLTSTGEYLVGGGSY